MRMRGIMATWKIAVGIVAAFAASGMVAAAEVRPLEFVRAMQEQGYGDLAADYLTMLKERSDLPKTLQEVWDLEMAKSLRGAASRAYNAAESERLNEAAKTHLERFFKERPDHPEAAAAQVAWAGFSVDRALQSLRAVEALPENDAARREKTLAARAALEEAKPRLRNAAESLAEKWRRLPAPAEPPKQSARRSSAKPDKAAVAAFQARARLQGEAANARFLTALVEYWIGQTYPAKSEKRRETLTAAAKAFDAIYQDHRLNAFYRVDPIGIAAHMWEGKSRDELGDYRTAKDIYEEVLANDPGPKPATADPLLDPLFAQVYHDYFAILAREEKGRYVIEANEWLLQYGEKLRRYEGYQSTALELAKVLFAASESPRVAASAKKKAVAEGMAILAVIKDVAGPHQREATALRRRYGQAAAGGAEGVKSFAEAVAAAETAAESGQWAVAIDAYRRALKMSDEAENPADVEKARVALVRVRVVDAERLLRIGKAREAFDAMQQLLDEEKKNPPHVAAAASTAVRAALALYASVPDSDAAGKGEAMSRLERVAKATIERWPGRPEADDARLALGRAVALRGEFDKAVQAFDAVHGRSERRPAALYLIALTRWQRYVEAKKNPKQSDAAREAERNKARESLEACLAELRTRPSNDPAVARQRIEANLLLAEIRYEAKQYREAAEGLGPLVDAAASASPEAVDPLNLRVLLTASQVYFALDDAEKAGRAATALADLGAETPGIGQALITFARSLDGERKKAEAALDAAKAADDKKAIGTAESRVASVRAATVALLKKTLERKDRTPTSTLILADLCGSAGLVQEAGRLYREVLQAADVDPKAAARARSQVSGILRREAEEAAKRRDDPRQRELAESKYSEAYQEVKKLIEAHEKALDPRVELARILQSWGELDPRHYDEALAQWTQVRNLLHPIRKKPLEYYEAIYNAAFCLYARSQTIPDERAVAEKLSQARGMLRSAMVLNERLSGPDMVQRYQTLIERIDRALGAKRP